MTKMKFRHDRIVLPMEVRELELHKLDDGRTVLRGFSDGVMSRCVFEAALELEASEPLKRVTNFEVTVDGESHKTQSTMRIGETHTEQYKNAAITAHLQEDGRIYLDVQTTAKADAPPQTATPVVEPICEGPTQGKIGDLEIPNVKIVPNEPLTDDWWKRSQMQTVGVTFYTPRDENGRLRNILEWTSGHVLVTLNGMVTSHPVLADAIAFEEPITSLYVLWQFGSRCFITTDKIEEYLDKPGHIIVAYLNRLTGLSIAMGPTTIVLPPKKEKAPANG